MKEIAMPSKMTPGAQKIFDAMVACKDQEDCYIRLSIGRGAYQFHGDTISEPTLKSLQPHLVRGVLSQLARKAAIGRDFTDDAKGAGK